MADYNRRRVLTIDDLPDDDLLAIFDFYVVRYQYLDFRQFSDHETKRQIESWQSLVHVCRRWRCLVFGSPRRLDLQLCCTTITPARKLDVWPALPLLVQGRVSKTSVDNFITVFENSDRICQIKLTTIPQIERLWTVPFPELVVLCLSCPNGNGPDYPDSFLGGSTPRLRYLDFTSISFPELPELLLSATHLVHLHLHSITQFGYISPEAMATCLSMLPSLESLRLEFKPSLYYSDTISRRPFPPTRTVLPALTSLSFQGWNKYLEDFVARIYAPQLYRLSTTLFNIYIYFIPVLNQLNQFISRTPTLGAYNEAYLIFGLGGARVRLCPFQPQLSEDRMVQVKVFDQVSDGQLSTLAQICTCSLRLLSIVENLYVDSYPGRLPHRWMHDIENTNLKWLNLLLPFTAVKNLYLSYRFLPRIALALQELTGGRATEVLPALRNVLLEGFQPSEPVPEGIAQFISARQLTNHPVVISVWDRDGSSVDDDSCVVDG